MEEVERDLMRVILKVSNLNLFVRCVKRRIDIRIVRFWRSKPRLVLNVLWVGVASNHLHNRSRCRLRDCNAICWSRRAVELV